MMQAMLNFDITARKHRGNVRSNEAHARVKPHKVTQKELIYKAIKSNGTTGMTNQELALYFDKGINCISPRTGELVLEGRVVVCEELSPRGNGNVLVAK